MLRTGTGIVQLRTSLLSVHGDVSRARGTLSTVLTVPSRSVKQDGLTRTTFPSAISVKIPLRLLSGHPSIHRTRVRLTRTFCTAGTTHTTFCPGVALSKALK